jgi:hypothetical protein
VEPNPNCLAGELLMYSATELLVKCHARKMFIAKRPAGSKFGYCPKKVLIDGTLALPLDSAVRMTFPRHSSLL